MTTTTQYVAAALASVEKYGFKKSSEEYSTRNHCDFLTGPEPSTTNSVVRQRWIDEQPTAEHVEWAEKIVAWCLSTADRSDYMRNLRDCCHNSHVTSYSRGLLASLPSAYERATAPKEPSLPAAGHVGTVGERIDTEVTVVFSRAYDSDYGTRTWLVMRDTVGHVFHWWATGNLGSDLKSGSWFIRGTVKRHEHDKRNNDPITVLTRCKMEREQLKLAKAKPRTKKVAVAA